MKKETFFKSLLKKDVDYPQRKIIEEFKRKFQHGLSFTTIKKLRDAYKSNQYDKVAPDVFKYSGGKSTRLAVVEAPAKKAVRKKPGRKKVARKVTKKAVKKGAKKGRRGKAAALEVTKVESVAALTPRRKVGRPSKVRGDRRGKASAQRGRRKADKLYVSFEKFPLHLVLLQEGGELKDYRFKSKADAKVFISKQIANGVLSEKIAYYPRSPFHFNVDISL